MNKLTIVRKMGIAGAYGPQTWWYHIISPLKWFLLCPTVKTHASCPYRQTDILQFNHWWRRMKYFTWLLSMSKDTNFYFYRVHLHNYVKQDYLQIKIQNEDHAVFTHASCHHVPLHGKNVSQTGLALNNVSSALCSIQFNSLKEHDIQ